MRTLAHLLDDAPETLFERTADQTHPLDDPAAWPKLIDNSEDDFAEEKRRRIRTHLRLSYVRCEHSCS